MRNRPIGRNPERPVPSFERNGPTLRSSQSCALAPHRTPAAPTPSSPMKTRRPTGVPRGFGPASSITTRIGTRHPSQIAVARGAFAEPRSFWDEFSTTTVENSAQKRELQPARGQARARISPKAASSELHERLGVGDRDRVDVDTDAARAAVRDQGDVGGRTCQWGERVQVRHLGAGDVDRERGAGHVARHEVGALEHRAEHRRGDRRRQLVEHAGERIGQLQRGLVSHLTRERGRCC